MNQYEVSAKLVSLSCSFAGYSKDSTWRPTGDQQLDWFVPCDQVYLVHTRLRSVVIVITIVRKTKPDPYDYDALTTTLSSAIFDSHRFLTSLTTTTTMLV